MAIIILTIKRTDLLVNDFLLTPRLWQVMIRK